MTLRLGAVAFSMALLAPCASVSQDNKDRFGLTRQPQVYLVHQTAKFNFKVESTGYRVMAGPIASMVQANESGKLQQTLDLRDPVSYLKERLAETLRRELALTNLQVEPNASDLPILSDKLGDEAIAAKAETFRDKHPTGAVIEVVTRHWGIDNYKMKYYASVWLTDLGQSKRLMSGSCPWVIFEQVDQTKTPARSAFDQYGKYDASAFDKDTVAIEQEIFGNNGEVLKANLRKAAEQCADRIAVRFVAGLKAK